MINLKAKKREEKVSNGIPAVLYGPKIGNISLEIDLKEFKEVYNKAGESTLITLLIGEEKALVLIHDVSFAPLTGEPFHVDFYQPILDKEVEAEVPLVFVGESPAVKNLGGTIVKEIQQVEVSALPQKLPHEIKVDLSKLETLEDEIKIKDLDIPQDVKVSKDPDETVANVQPPQKVEEELEEPIEENVEGVEKVEKPAEDEETE